MAKTNYDNIDGKSVWDLYVENFRDGLWDLAPKFAWDLEGGGFRVTSSPWDAEETTEEVSEPPKPKKKKTKNATKNATTDMTKTGRVGDKPVDGLTRPPVRVRIKPEGRGDEATIPSTETVEA